MKRAQFYLLLAVIMGSGTDPYRNWYAGILAGLAAVYWLYPPASERSDK